MAASMKNFHFTDLFLGACIAGFFGLVVYGVLSLIGIANVAIAIVAGAAIAFLLMKGDAVDVLDYSLRYNDKEKN